MTTEHWLILIHPILAIIVVLPTVGIVTHYSWQLRQRRLKTQVKEKTKIPPTVGPNHVNIGRWLAVFVIGVTLVGLALFLRISRQQDSGRKTRYRCCWLL